MTKFYCPTCKELRGAIIEGEVSLTLDCKHTRPRLIPLKDKIGSFIELPNFAKWYAHNIDHAGLGKTAEQLKIVDNEVNGENLGV